MLCAASSKPIGKESDTNFQSGKFSIFTWTIRCEQSQFFRMLRRDNSETEISATVSYLCHLTFGKANNEGILELWYLQVCKPGQQQSVID